MSSLFQLGIFISGLIISLTKQVFAPGNTGQFLEGGDKAEGGDGCLVLIALEKNSVDLGQFF